MLGAAAVAASVVSCGGGDESSTVTVKGVEYAFEMPNQSEGGVVKMNFENAGGELHEFALARLDEGKTQADVEAYVESGREDPPSWAEDVAGVPLLSPGEELSITRELDPGTYTFLCFIPSPKGTPHVRLGMLKTFELEGDSGNELPGADAVITASEQGYDIPQTEAGSQTLELRNADNKEREFFLVALEPGKEIQDVDRFFAQGEDLADPPATFLGAMQTIPPGTSVFLDTELESGVEYTLSDTSGRQPVVATFTPE